MKHLGRRTVLVLTLTAAASLGHGTHSATTTHAATSQLLAAKASPARPGQCAAKPDPTLTGTVTEPSACPQRPWQSVKQRIPALRDYMQLLIRLFEWVIRLLGSDNPVQQPPSPLPTPTPAPAPAPSRPIPTPPTPDPNPAPSAPNPAPSLPPGTDAELAQVLAHVNNERAKGGVGPLQLDDCLSTKVAQPWAAYMAQTGDFRHQSLADVGTKCPGFRYAGENIAMGQRDAKAVMDSWMTSPGHRQNIMNGQYTHLGLGLARTSSGTPYWVQNFSRAS